MSEELRVLEIGSSVASAYAARLLGDHGADVIKIEAPEGDPLRWRGPFPGGREDPEQSGLFLALNLNKRGVTSGNDRNVQLDRLLQWADILVHDLAAEQAKKRSLDAAAIARQHPHLVTLTLTPFGHTGPYAGYKAEELTVINAGGWANLCPSTNSDPALPPLKVPGDQCALMSAVAGATAALAFARSAKVSGMGEYIDFSLQEYVASVLEGGLPAFSYNKEVSARYHQRSLIPWRIFQAKDAPIFIVVIEQDQWERLVKLMGNPEWASLEPFADRAARAENQDLVHTFVQEFVSEWKADDLYHAAQQQRICAAPILGFADISCNHHLRERDFFLTLDRDPDTPVEYLASPVLGKDGRAPVRLPAPSLGEHNSALENLTIPERTSPGAGQCPLPLEGMRVLDLTWAWAGPFCSMNLAYLGAQVIRIESEKRPDIYRRLPFYPDDFDPDLEEPGLNISGMFNQWNQGKSSMSIDLTKAEGIGIILELVKQSDVVVQNFATGVMERMGMGYETLRDINPRIILASISGYGQTGPWRDYMGYGPAIPPLTGMSAGTGYIGGGPDEIGISMPDPNAGITAALAVVSALTRRDTTGEGDHLDVTLWESTGVLNVEAWMNYVFNQEEPQRMGNRSTMMSPHGCFPCASGDPDEAAWVSIACRSDKEWRRLAQMIDPELADDSRFSSLVSRKQHENELECIISSWTRDSDRWEITRQLQIAGIAAFPTLSTRDIVEDPHLNARGFIERLYHPEVGKRAHSGIPWRLHHRRNGVTKPAPCLGADTDRHLSEILGLSKVQIQQLYDSKIIGV